MTGAIRLETSFASNADLNAFPSTLVTDSKPSGTVQAKMLHLEQRQSPEHILAEQSTEEAGTVPGPALRCRVCGSVITSQDQRIAVNGRHDHVFFNPHGRVFEIGCFARAPGAVPASPPSAEFSWFPGLAWQVAACATCQAHLGWRFQDARHSGFFGLILDRLIEEG